MKPPLHSKDLFAASVVAAILISLWFLPSNARAQEKMSLDLDKAVQLATAHNRKTKMREDEVDAAVYRRKQAMGRFLPKLSLSARYSRVSLVEPGSLNLPTPTITGQPTDPVNTVQLGEAVDNQYSLRLAVDQPLFTGFGLWNGYQATKHVETIAHQRVYAERNEVRAVTQETYFNLLKAQQMLEVSEQLIQALEKHLQQVKLLYDSGRATELDISRVQSRVAAARVSLVQMQGAKDGLHLALTTLLGIPSTTDIELADIVEAKTPESIPETEKLLAEAFVSRPEIAIAKEAEALAASRIDIESAALWPQVSLRFGYNYDRPNQRYFPAHDRFDGSWDISAVLSWTAWDWGVTYYGMKAAQAEASAATKNVDEIRDMVRLDVEKQRQGYKSAKEKITSAKQALDSAEKAYDAAKILFDAGRAQSLDLLDAATELTRAKSDFIQSLADARIAWALVQKATGRD